jgi:hypothetical protein
MRLLTDEHMDARVVDALRPYHGHDVVTVRQTCENKSGDGISDEQVLRHALAERRIIITDNRKHFRQLHLSMPWHEGIVVCPVYDDAREKALRINDLLQRTLEGVGIPRLTGQLMSICSESERLAHEHTHLE